MWLDRNPLYIVESTSCAPHALFPASVDAPPMCGPPGTRELRNTRAATSGELQQHSSRNWMTVSTHHGRRIFNQASPIGYWYQCWHQCGTGNRAVLDSQAAALTAVGPSSLLPSLRLTPRLAPPACYPHCGWPLGWPLQYSSYYALKSVCRKSVLTSEYGTWYPGVP